MNEEHPMCPKPAPMTPIEKRKQLSNCFVVLLCAEIPVLQSLTGIERQLIDSFTQSLLVSYGEYLGAKRVD